ncbi:MAG: entericidin, EcnA/B family [Pseudomonadales bacterium]|jgi:predicted small secreted protein|uniref:Predicted small secreted protein n=1 Tax=Halopseudomonas aestusnigri TaxID=857252 RepID=A0AAQ1JNN4_9GAMM|nr:MULTISPECIES: entericidin A/B family lipoprotein [Halopseudomonas]MAD26912.1 entericidin, EcnA/B family [Pseudomonadales bacterium]MEE2798525.1 entericidin A/B family lipoprotein [Pseudomonadota bacterium]HCP05311.1 entericidin, EcnA/B family [Pseudomonas sp.]MAH00957.1 entericidin, EcnA/B family [Pseudomonadales bacterium]MAP75825.1 entericidin, EcnA/B family [Pseudomonadales bacterium]|tara:strand:- start:10233 stop:10367 length:135 start_codon:yes stop_codon:yes gene_type:complete
MKRSRVLLLSVLFSLAGLSACNTMEGLGKDIQKVGDSIEDAANR